MTGAPRYFYGRWPDDPIPQGSPEHLFYEVDARGAVPRLVERYPDGRAERNSLELDGGPWGDIPSLVDIDFFDWVEDAALEEIEAETFEREWTDAQERGRGVV